MAIAHVWCHFATACYFLYAESGSRPCSPVQRSDWCGLQAARTIDDGQLWAKEPPLDPHGWRRSQIIYHDSTPYSPGTSRSIKLELVFQTRVIVILLPKY